MGKAKYMSLIVLASVLLYIGLSPLRAIDVRLSVAVQPLVYFFFSYISFRKGERKGHNILPVFTAIILGILILDLPMRIKDWNITYCSILPSVCSLISTVVAYSYYKNGRKAIPVVIVAIFLWIYCIFWGQEKLWNYKSFGHFSPIVNISNGIGDAIVYESSHDSLRLKDLKHKYLFLDFWNSGCGFCYKKFPSLQKLYDEYQQRDDVFVSSVFVNYRKNETLDSGDSILAKLNYTFPVLSTKRDAVFFLKSGVKAFPTVLILDEKRNVIYMGRFDEASDYLKKILDD